MLFVPRLNGVPHVVAVFDLRQMTPRNPGTRGELLEREALSSTLGVIRSPTCRIA